MTQPIPSPDVPDELDRAFSNYFKAQLPSAWPACRATAPVEAAKPVQSNDRDPSWASRGTLVASVALLLGLGFYFSSNLTTPATQVGTNGSFLNKATAEGSGLLKSAPPAGKLDDPMKNIPPMPMP